MNRYIATHRFCTEKERGIDKSTEKKHQSRDLITCKMFRAFLMSPLLSRTTAAKPLSDTSSLVQSTNVNISIHF